MGNVLRELIYGLRRSFFPNLVIIIQFSLFFWLFLKVSTYYINVKSATFVNNSIDNHQYYTLIESNAESSVEVSLSIEDDPMFVDNAKTALKEVAREKDFEFMTINQNDYVWIDVNVMKERFGQDNYDDFLSGSLYPGFYSNPVNEKPEPCVFDLENIFETPMVAIPMSVVRMDKAAVKHYRLSVGEGRTFGNQDYVWNLQEGKCGVLMGAKYRKYFKVGDVFTVFTGLVISKVTVIGFLEENTTLIADFTNGEPYNLDYTMVMPYFDIEGAVETEEQKIFLGSNYYLSLLGTLVFDKDATQSTILNAQKRINEIFLGNHLFTITAINAPEGVYLFQGETRQTVHVITMLLTVMLGFNLFGLCLSLLNKLNGNLNRYAIQLMNGQKLSVIVTAYLLETMLIVLTAGIVTAYRVWSKIMLNPAYGWLLVATVCGLLAPCVSFMLIRLKRIDIESLIRRRE